MQDINKSGDRLQVILIILGVIVTLLFMAFLYREAFPEYKIYQKDYIALENFRSTYTGESPPEFSIGIKQIVLPREDKGPPNIDRCVSCHVALTYPHFSPTKIARSLDGEIIYDEDGIPVKVPNEEDVWFRLDQKIKQLEASHNQKEADYLKSLKTASVGEHIYDVTKVLRMHPLIGAETRPFEFHSIEEIGCTSCHNGNGLGLTTEKAHGPITDGTYEIEFEGPIPKFTESDPLNDPPFSKRYNGKPGGELLFQTTPLFVGALIQAKCMQCHQSTEDGIKTLDLQYNVLSEKNQKRLNLIQASFNLDQANLLKLVQLKNQVLSENVNKVVDDLKSKLSNLDLLEEERTKLKSNLDLLLMWVHGKDGLRKENESVAKDVVLENLNREIQLILGSYRLNEALSQNLLKSDENQGEVLGKFLVDHEADVDATGLIFNKLKRLEALSKIRQNETFKIPDHIKKIDSSVDQFTKNYRRGEELFVAQGCYACHRISGVSRGGVGPELTEIGKGYPWYIKQKLVYPQSTLKTSTMPNYKLDHNELEDLMTFLLGQTGQTKTLSENFYKIHIRDWEAGQKNKIEKPLSPSLIHDLDHSMTIFATEGCAACHRLKGFQSSVQFKTETTKADFNDIYQEKSWFRSIIPENVTASQLVNILENKGKIIDERIVIGERKNGILEQIEAKYPDLLESYYTEFSFAKRAKTKEYELKLKNTTDENERKALNLEHQQWIDRVHLVFMMYIQEYGLGRLIGPKLHWSGVYRSDEWLMQHFRNPSGHIANSIMPIFPFDDTKFYALTSMLDILGQKNRKEVREIWNHLGFSPELAYDLHCSQCHGNYLGGNGPVAEWIYPIPKNLRNAEFLRNLTKENAIHSIVHGVKGTPMAPWGETPLDKENYEGVPVLKSEEVKRLVDWIYSQLPGEKIIQESKDVPKWQYQPKDIHQELENEGNVLKGKEDPLASIIPLKPYKEAQDAIFDIYQDDKTPSNLAYYIKQKYYTQENIEAGKQFFEMNCAVCHGKEGDGTGARGAVMQDARPRKLTNLDWLSTRDDLWLLRSIKYGVSGTSMGAWGDLTTSLQRLQLVIFIRSLSGHEEYRKLLSDEIYESFDKSFILVENVRSKLDEKIKGVKEKIANIEISAKDDAAYLNQHKDQLALKEELNLLNEQDQKYQKIQLDIREESKVYQQLGIDLIEKNVDEALIQLYLSLIRINQNQLKVEGESLEINDDLKKMEEIKVKRDQIIKILQDEINKLQNKKKLHENHLDEIKAIDIEIESHQKLIQEIYSSLKKVFSLMESIKKGLTHDKI